MNKQMHLTHPETVEEKMYSINYKWHFISEEDRDFYQGCRYALTTDLSGERRSLQSNILQ